MQRTVTIAATMRALAMHYIPACLAGHAASHVDVKDGMQVMAMKNSGTHASQCLT